jgi:hypothetical protein
MSMREREEVQEMPRGLGTAHSFWLCFVTAALALPAAILPEQIGTAKRTAPAQLVQYADKPLAEEWGLAAAETAEYSALAPAALKYKVTAWQLKDPTAALAFYQASRDPKATPAQVEKHSVSEPTGSIFLARGNYCLRFTGWTPVKTDLDQLFAVLPKLDQSALPNIPAYFPPEGRLANSERLILGPTSLERFEGRISSGTVAFSMGAEGATARYGDGISLTIFNYPTPHIARERVEELRKVSGSVVKRAGPLAAVVLGASDPSAAERLLAKVNYQATLTWNEANPEVEDRRGASFLLGAFTLAGILMLMCVGAGVAFGLIRVARMRLGKGDEEPAMIRLDLGN